MNSIFNLGIQLIQALQAMSPVLDGVMKFFSFLGTIEFYLLLIPFVYWVVDARLGFRLLLVLISTDFLALGFKQLLRQPRPYWIGGVKALAEETSYGYTLQPCQRFAGRVGLPGLPPEKGLAVGPGVVVVALIGLSRMYLGVHFPTDVLVGWLIGLAVIVIFAVGERWAASRLERLSAGGQIGLGFVLSLLIILAGWIINLLIAPYPDPPEWAQFALDARGISHYFTLAGALFGAVAGYVIMRSRSPFPGPRLKLAAGRPFPAGDCRRFSALPGAGCALRVCWQQMRPALAWSCAISVTRRSPSGRYLARHGFS